MDSGIKKFECTLFVSGNLLLFPGFGWKWNLEALPHNERTENIKGKNLSVRFHEGKNGAL